MLGGCVVVVSFTQSRWNNEHIPGLPPSEASAVTAAVTAEGTPGATAVAAATSVAATVAAWTSASSPTLGR